MTADIQNAVPETAVVPEAAGVAKETPTPAKENRLVSSLSVADSSYWSKVTPKRPRKQVESLKFETPATPSEFAAPKGKGKEIGEIGNINHNLKIRSQNDPFAKRLHQLMFGKPGKKTMLFRHIRQFCGWEWKDAEEKEKVLAAAREKVKKWVLADVKEIAKILDLKSEDIKTKDDYANAVVDFLAKPKGVSEVTIAKTPKGKKGTKRKSTTSKKKRKTPKSSAKKAKKARKAKKEDEDEEELEKIDEEPEKMEVDQESHGDVYGSSDKDDTAPKAAEKEVREEDGSFALPSPATETPDNESSKSPEPVKESVPAETQKDIETEESEKMTDDQPIEKPVEKEVEKKEIPAEDSQKMTDETTAEIPVEAPKEIVAEVPKADSPVEKVAESPVEKVAEASPEIEKVSETEKAPEKEPETVPEKVVEPTPEADKDTVMTEAPKEAPKESPTVSEPEQEKIVAKPAEIDISKPAEVTPSATPTKKKIVLKAKCRTPEQPKVQPKVNEPENEKPTENIEISNGTDKSEISKGIETTPNADLTNGTSQPMKM